MQKPAEIVLFLHQAESLLFYTLPDGNKNLIS